MCGIAGLITTSEHRSALPSLERINQSIERMTTALAHRGNDSVGFYTSPDGRVAFGHRRLSIIDRSEAGFQPMKTSDERYLIVFNGEIYNYKELAQELTRKNGVTFRTVSDTEVLLAAYLTWGTACLDKLRGMFAFVIYDTKKHTFFIARDPLGIKPLYWFYDGTTFLFASEIKALLASGFVSKKLNKKALYEYLRMYSIQAPGTIVADVFALKPGHYAEVSSAGVKTFSYWNPGMVSTVDPHKSYNDILASVKEHLLESVALHMRADIPVGMFLSGGLDSSALVALAKNVTGGMLHTFSIGFGKEGSYLDEVSVASRVAAHFGTKHKTVVIDGSSFKRHLNNFIAHIDQPSGDGINSFLVSKAASEDVSVALSGLGGDELFLGYRYFQEIAALERWRQMGLNSFLPALSLGFKSSSVVQAVTRRMGLGALKFWPAKQDGFYTAQRELFSAAAVEMLVRRGTFKGEDKSFNTSDLRHIFEEEKDLLNAFSKAELSWYTPGMLLRDADATSMASTLELRVPFLDRALVENVLSLPSHYKLYYRQDTNKPLLVDALKGLMPEMVLDQPKKGFEMPIGFWLRNYCTSELRGVAKIPWINKQYATTMLENFYKNPRNYLPMWSLLVVRKFLDHTGLEVSDV